VRRCRRVFTQPHRESRPFDALPLQSPALKTWNNQSGPPRNIARHSLLTLFQDISDIKTHSKISSNSSIYRRTKNWNSKHVSAPGLLSNPCVLLFVHVWRQYVYRLSRIVLKCAESAVLLMLQCSVQTSNFDYDRIPSVSAKQESMDQWINRSVAHDCITARRHAPQQCAMLQQLPVDSLHSPLIVDAAALLITLLSMRGWP
jgi:hypothetical protein